MLSPLFRSRTAVRFLGLAIVLCLLPAAALASRTEVPITVNDDEIVVVRQANALMHFEDPVPLYPGYPTPPDNTTAAWDDLDVGDLNGDGDAEIAAIHVLSKRLKVFDPTVQPGSDPMTLDTTYGTARTRIVTADVDGDGERELALIRDFDTDDLCAVNVTNQYTGELMAQQICVTLWHDLAAADLNGDGDDELVMVKRNTDAPNSPGKLVVWDVFVQPGETEIEFQENPSLFWWRDVASGDVDGDGADEAILIRDTDKRLVVRKWNGTTMALLHEEYFDEPWDRVAAGDIDGDGEDEIVLVKADLVTYVDLDGTLAASIVEGPAPLQGSWTGVATGDLNDDGDDEVVLLTSDSRIVVDDPVVQMGSEPVVFEEVYTAPWDLVGVGSFDGSVTFEPAPVLVEPSEVSIDAEVGEVHTVLLSVTSPDGSPLDWVAVPGNKPNWVSVSPLSGTTPSQVTLVANCVGVAQDTYEMTLTFSEVGGTTSLEVPVTIIVDAPALSVVPTRVTFFHALGSPDPAPKEIAITQRGGDGQGIQWSALILGRAEAASLAGLSEAELLERLTGATPSQVDWLALDPESGTTPSLMSATFSLAGLGLGTHEATIVVDGGAGTQNRIQTVDVTVIVASDVFQLYMPTLLRDQ